MLPTNYLWSSLLSDGLRPDKSEYCQDTSLQPAYPQQTMPWRLININSMPPAEQFVRSLLIMTWKCQISRLNEIKHGKRRAVISEASTLLGQRLIQPQRQCPSASLESSPVSDTGFLDFPCDCNQSGRVPLCIAHVVGDPDGSATEQPVRSASMQAVPHLIFSSPGAMVNFYFQLMNSPTSTLAEHTDGFVDIRKDAISVSECTDVLGRLSFRRRT